MTDNNWRYWERVIRTVLEGRELSNMVTKDTPQPNDKDSSKNNTAMSILLTSLEEDQLPYLGDTDVAKEPWKNLTKRQGTEDCYTYPSDRFSDSSHVMRPTSARPSPSSPINSNRNFFTLKEAGVAFAELVGIGILLHKLPKPYGLFYKPSSSPIRH